MKAEHISDTLTKIFLEDKEILIVGTAHVSSESVKEVEQLIIDEHPDRVCLELDAGRYKTMKEGQSYENLNIGNILKQGKGFLLLANLALSSFQKRMGKQTGVAPGEEMKIASEAAEKAGIPYTLCDREIQTTLRRAWMKSSFWNKLKLMGTLISSAFSREELKDEDIEKLKEKNALQGMLEELSHELPTVKEVLIDERDKYLATKIFTAPGKKILAVIGAGHAEGLIHTLSQLETNSEYVNLSELETIPKASKALKFIPWIIPAIILGILAYGFINAGWTQGLKMFFYWFMVNGVLSGIGAIIALAHPLTIILSFLLAPFTSLNPTIGVGIVVGMVEAIIKKPRVKDFENLNEDILSIKGFYKNRFTHALLVFFLTSIGSSIGTFVAFPFLITLLNN